jgi:hypothetical protein
VALDGPDAFVLRPEDDVDAFAAALRRLGVSFAIDREPVPVFHALSRRVSLDEVMGAAGMAEADAPDE